LLFTSVLLGLLLHLRHLPLPISGGGRCDFIRVPLSVSPRRFSPLLPNSL